jgi:hypothetical protein
MGRHPVPSEIVLKQKQERAEAKAKKREENRALYDAQRSSQGNKQSASIPLEIADKISVAIDSDYKEYGDTEEDLESFKNAAHDYMDMCDSCKYPIYQAGVALACGISEQALKELGQNPFYSKAVSVVMTRVSAYAQRMLYLGYSATGPIFALKQQGWADKADVPEGKSKNDLNAKTEMELVDEFLSRLKDAGLEDFANQFKSMYMPVQIGTRGSTKKED